MRVLIGFGKREKRAKRLKLKATHRKVFLPTITTKIFKIGGEEAARLLKFRSSYFKLESLIVAQIPVCPSGTTVFHEVSSRTKRLHYRNRENSPLGATYIH